jgi:uncharacterized protein (DUF1919 family)
MYIYSGKLHYRIQRIKKKSFYVKNAFKREVRGASVWLLNRKPDSPAVQFCCHPMPATGSRTTTAFSYKTGKYKGH